MLRVTPHRARIGLRVLERFGGGDILIGAHAVNAGLADRIGSLEKLIAEFSASSNPAFQRGFLLPATTKKETVMDLPTLILCAVTATSNNQPFNPQPPTAL